MPYAYRRAGVTWPTENGRVLNRVKTVWCTALARKASLASWPRYGVYSSSCGAEHPQQAQARIIYRRQLCCMPETSPDSTEHMKAVGQREACLQECLVACE